MFYFSNFVSSDCLICVHLYLLEMHIILEHFSSYLSYVKYLEVLM